MARVVATNLQLGGNQILGLRVEVLASDPTGGDLYEGRLWFNSTSNLLKYYDGAATVELGAAAGGGVETLGVTSPLQNTGTANDPVVALKTGGGAGSANGIINVHIASDAAIALSKLATDPLARGNHTGTQAAATISDFDTQVRTSRLDQMAAPTASVSMGSQLVTNVLTPSGDTDAANKAYVDAARSGLDVKASVRAATTAAGTLASSFENGDTVDGVALATGDRILIKDQAAGAENGIYTVNASGAPTRATDADANAEVTAGMFVFVEQGTVNADSGWVLTNDGAVTLGSTALTFAQFSGAGQIIAGAALLKTGNTLDVGVDNVSVEVSGDALRVKAAGVTNAMLAGSIDLAAKVTGSLPVANGGTGATDAAGARTNLGATTKYATDVGNASALFFVVTHNLNTRDVVVMVRANADPWAEVIADVEMTSVNTITVRFAVAPANNAYRVVVIG